MREGGREGIKIENIIILLLLLLYDIIILVNLCQDTTTTTTNSFTLYCTRALYDAPCTTHHTTSGLFGISIVFMQERVVFIVSNSLLCILLVSEYNTSNRTHAQSIITPSSLPRICLRQAIFRWSSHRQTTRLAGVLAKNW